MSNEGENSHYSLLVIFDNSSRYEYSLAHSRSKGHGMALSSAELYALIMAALTSLQDDGHQFERGIERARLTHDEFWLLNRFRYFPGSAAPGDFLTFGPYTSVSIYERNLEALVSKKYAETIEPGRYRSSESGRKLIDTQYRDYFNAIARHKILTEAEVRRLGELADRAVNAAVRQPDVPAPLTNAARSTFPDVDQPWVYAERRVVAMALFRGDAHIAAWRDDGWSGPRIAVSTALFNTTERLSAAQLREATARLDDKDFKSAVAALHSGGEVSHNADDQYTLTRSGRAARQVVEDQTDYNFAVMFNIFDQAELQDFIQLLERVRGPIGA
jgi:hypothetical protein